VARVGVLALQGAFEAQVEVLRRLNHDVVEVRSAEALEGIDGLVFPGGESTTQLKLMAWGEMLSALHGFVASGRPVLGTCAGLILAAREVLPGPQESLDWIDVTVQRNGYGRQLDSFEARSDGGRTLMFIRAPRITRVGPGVEVLDTLDGEPVLVRQGKVVGTAFHPELSDDVDIFRELFV